MISMMLNNGAIRWEIPIGDPKGATELERIADMSGTPVGPTSPQTGVEGNLVLLAAVAVVVLFGAVFLLKKSYAR